MDNIATVKDMYAAFGRGDIPAILDRMADDVDWDPAPTSGRDAGVPWLAHRTRRDGVAEFFASLEPLEFPRFEPHTYLANGHQVAAIITPPSTSRRHARHSSSSAPGGRVPSRRRASAWRA
jgi:uncharacterized protein